VVTAVVLPLVVTLIFVLRVTRAVLVLQVGVVEEVDTVLLDAFPEVFTGLEIQFLV
jgi:hypothetical protein